MPQVKFVNEKKTIEVPEGANLRAAAKRNGVRPGRRVLITRGQQNVSPPGFAERMQLMGPLSFWYGLGREEQMRLSASVQVHGDIEVQTKPSMNWHGEKFWG